MYDVRRLQRDGFEGASTVGRLVLVCLMVGILNTAAMTQKSLYEFGHEKEERQGYETKMRDGAIINGVRGRRRRRLSWGSISYILFFNFQKKPAVILCFCHGSSPS